MENYEQRGRAQRFWNRVSVFFVFALLPVVVFGAMVARNSGDFPALPYLLVVMWLVALGGTLYRVRTFRCPRCGKTFSVEGWWSPSPRGRKCVHCALELNIRT